MPDEGNGIPSRQYSPSPPLAFLYPTLSPIRNSCPLCFYEFMTYHWTFMVPRSFLRFLKVLEGFLKGSFRLPKGSFCCL